MNAHIKRNDKTSIRIGIIKEIYQPGMSALDIANAVAARTHEQLSRMVIMGIYARNRAELAEYPLRAWGETKQSAKLKRDRRHRENDAKRERRRLARIQREAERAAAPPRPRKERKAPEPSEPQAYDATATLKRLFELGAHECRWPIIGSKADTLFCGHRAAGVYCDHHQLRSVGKGTISEQRAPNDLRRYAA
ncbi:hypothetical protein B5M44_24955 [Shinella sumterensis]|uniref:GcrA family cell cycle regulator n=1 Tax=Shinella sumterensis TaxID=1967501 RepID=UPI00106E0A03|nr:GcrA family cell cycle regulator [Shinella sumterensis]MCD1266051.1 hypothetical protein [Shinella sumterensis]TFE93521.1 hypothetical protein B5M44_24955 [Shinella sumterensis]